MMTGEKNMGIFSEKKISVLGLGKSGYESALFLKERGAEVYASEIAVGDEFLKRKSELESQEIEVEIGSHDLSRILASHFTVVSPGIAPHTDVIKTLRAKHHLLISEIELAYRFFEGTVVAVTGTNGKTTTTTLAAGILRHFGQIAFSCGNIGNPFIGEVRKGNTQGTAVVEVSSFQLETIQMFQPQIAFLLNVEPDHIDWHGNFEKYLNAKLRIFENQKADNIAILNYQDSAIQKSISKIRPRIFFFNEKEGTGNPNWDAVLCLCDVFGWDRKSGEAFLNNAPQIEHRLEKVDSGDDVIYINDSKSTNPSSLAYALERQSQKVILIVGGKNKGNRFDHLRPLIREKVKHLIIFGECRDLLREDLGETTTFEIAENLTDVLSRARRVSRRGDVVLFSPGCASFDMFKNYEDRGRQFKGLVLAQREVHVA